MVNELLQHGSPVGGEDKSYFYSLQKQSSPGRDSPRVKGTGRPSKGSPVCPGLLSGVPRLKIFFSFTGGEGSELLR